MRGMITLDDFKAMCDVLCHQRYNKPSDNTHKSTRPKMKIFIDEGLITPSILNPNKTFTPEYNTMIELYHDDTSVKLTSICNMGHKTLENRLINKSKQSVIDDDETSTISTPVLKEQNDFTSSKSHHLQKPLSQYNVIDNKHHTHYHRRYGQ